MTHEINRILITGATGYIADQMLPTFRDRYETVLVDTREENRRGEPVCGLHVADLSDPDNGKYIDLFNEVDAVVHLAYMRRIGKPIDHFETEKKNVEMAVNKLKKLNLDIDLIIYVGQLKKIPKNLIKIPDFFLKKQRTISGKILDTTQINEKVYNIFNWNINLSNFDIK